MGVQRGESSEVQKVGFDFDTVELSTGHSGPFQGDLETTPATSLASHLESRLRSHGWVTGSVCLRSHTQRRAGVCQTLSHFSRFEALWRSDSCSLFPSLLGVLWCAEVP